ncbi:hypothetical protein H5P27_09695 [Pelagicoccus albus]|uniref:Uncharacterized protein n=2 Tax=Pelagicoccus albus TaxID=415222 RepID=A0A7X1E8J0_9BACT|nr:hypothetical protein [Pelagicoccus albus]MBC2606321.1 hypothetical protein [Pelagicoccus albus]
MNQPLHELTSDDLIVLFEWLSHNEEKEEVTFSDLSELIVLDKIQGLLEKAMVEPFKTNYGEVLLESRTRIKNEFEEKMGIETWLHKLLKNESAEKNK